VDNLLDLSRLESGRLILRKRLVDVCELVQEVAAGMAAQMADHSLVLDLEGQDLVVAADAGQMERVVVNLLSNAIKYSPGGGTIRIAAHADGEQVTLLVSDKGIGIPEDEQQRVFERFYRVENEITRQVAGVGLGLAVCRGIVEAHGGSIWVESEPGRGSTFYVSLPVKGE
jgi:signal transduction histidine kinase